jgi:CheY-like chemotaxis protein
MGDDLVKRTRPALPGMPRVMVIEDDDVTREAMVELLRLEGGAVTAARDYRDALDLLGEGIALDVQTD